MTPIDPSAPHAPYVRKLVNAGDWAGLARYWMAHQFHDPALASSISLVNKRARSCHDPWWAVANFLREFRRQPVSLERQQPRIPAGKLSKNERGTLDLLLLLPQVMHCEFGRQSPLTSQSQAFKAGLSAVNQASAIADSLDDGALLAFLKGLKACAERGLNDLESARASCAGALAAYRYLAVRRPEVYRPLVAGFLHDLGNFQRIFGQIDSARASYEEAIDIRRDLAVIRPDVYRPLVAKTLNNLGAVQRLLNEPESALASYQEALAIYRDPEARWLDVYRPDIAMTLSNLGNVQIDLNELEAAWATIKEASTTYRSLPQQQPEAYRRELAMTLNKLGNVQSILKNPEAARASYEEALALCRDLARQRPEVYRPDVASILNNLGFVRRDLKDPTSAKECFEEALISYRDLAQQRPEIYRRDVAMTLNNLGTLQFDLDDAKSARSNCEEALAICRDLDREHSGIHRQLLAMTLTNLGNAMGRLNDLAAARSNYEEAAELYDQQSAQQPTARLVERQATWANLGRLVLQERPELGWPDRPAARAAFQKAVACAELFREQFRDERQRRRVQAENLEVYERLIEVCVDLWEIEREPTALAEAVETAEKSRARRLMELLARESLRPANTPPDLDAEFQALRDRLQRALLRLQHEVELRGGGGDRPPIVGDGDGRSGRAPSADRDPDLHPLQADVDRIETEYRNVLRRVRVHDPEFHPDRPVVPVDAVKAQGLLPRDVPTAIVQYTITSRRGLALVITEAGIESVPLPELDVRRAWVGEWFQGYYETCRIDGRLDGQSWSAWMAPLLETLGRQIIRPVVERLKAVRRLILVPNRALHVFPLHACPLEDGGTVGDAFEVVYTPSLSILHRCAERSRPRPDRLLTVENPTGDLGFTESESAVIRPHFAAHERRRLADARREWLLEHSGRFQSWHYAGHSWFNPGDPLASGLVLEDVERPDRWLTLRDVFTTMKLPEASLAVLSGCESGSIRPDQIDEYVGLPSGFLFAGATCVVASLWSVPDLATAVLMGRFYANWRERGMHIAAALREAQRWLRDGIKTGAQLREEVATEAFLDHVTDPERREQCRRQRDAMVRAYPDSPPFAGVANWAAFTAIGLAYPRPERAAPNGTVSPG